MDIGVRDGNGRGTRIGASSSAPGRGAPAANGRAGMKAPGRLGHMEQNGRKLGVAGAGLSVRTGRRA